MCEDDDADDIILAEKISFLYRLAQLYIWYNHYADEKSKNSQTLVLTRTCKFREAQVPITKYTDLAFSPMEHRV